MDFRRPPFGAGVTKRPQRAQAHHKTRPEEIEAKAKAEGVGLWRDVLAMSPWGGRHLQRAATPPKWRQR
jgi:hypothetical protein